VTSASTENPIDTLASTNNLRIFNKMQAVTKQRHIWSFVSRVYYREFFGISAVFSTLFEFGNEIAPPASQGPNQKH